MKLSDVLLGCSTVLGLADEAQRVVASAKAAKVAGSNVVELCRLLRGLRKRAAQEESER